LAEWRLLPLRIDDAFMSMAIDEALLWLNSRGKSPNTIRFWRWLPSAVSIGCFQSVEREVNLDVAKKYGVDVVRRITGGGAVFHDHDGELTYSVVCRQDDIPDDIIESYKLICGGLVKGFERLGLRAEFRPVNDVQVNGKKISGSAQTRRWGSVLQHGTVLIDPDIRLMFELLRIGPEKISDKFIASAYERVTTIGRELGRKPSFEEVEKAMSEGFADAFGIELVEGDLTEEELGLAAKLKPMYASNEWLRKR
jgi:lipoate-protein ligase A